MHCSHAGCAATACWSDGLTAQRKNFAVHLPLIDWVFGTYYLPGDRWPVRYGLEDDPIPEGYARQLVYPFSRSGPFLR